MFCLKPLLHFILCSNILFSNITYDLILVRHGQRNGTNLSELGERQVALAGERLKELNFNFTSIKTSNLTRGIQSAQIIHDVMGLNLDIVEDSDLDELDPDNAENDDQIERAYTKYFTPNLNLVPNSQMLLVFHANIMRTLVLK